MTKSLDISRLFRIPIFIFFANSSSFIRKIIYTTKIIEGLNLQFRQITRNKPIFTNDDSLRKILYLASSKIVRHWTARCRNWDIILSQLQLMFQDQRSARPALPSSVSGKGGL